MRLGRAGSKSNHAYTKDVRHIDMITPGIELLRTAELQSNEGANNELQESAAAGQSVGAVQPTQGSAENSRELVVMPSDPTPPESNLNPSSTNFLTGVTLTETPVSRTKGRKSSSGAICAENNRMPDNPYITYSGSQGKRECQIFHVRGYYSTTCPQNPDRSRAA